MSDAPRADAPVSPQRGRAVRWSVLRRVVRQIAGSRRGLIGGVVASTVAQSVLALVPVLIIEAFVNDLQKRHVSFGKIALLFVAGAGIVLLGGLIGLLRTRLLLIVRSQVIAEVRQQVAERLLGQSLSYFTRSRGGELMSRLLNDVSAVNTTFDSIMSTATGSITLVIVVAGMVVLEWHLALLTLLIIPILVFGLKLGSRPIYRTRLAVQQQLAALTRQLQDSLSLSGIMLIKSFGRESDERERLAGMNNALMQGQVRAGMVAGWIGVWLTLLQFIGPAALLIVGAWLVVHGSITLGTLTAFATVLALRFAVAMTSVGNGAVSVIGSLPAWARIFEVLDATVEIEDRPDAVALQNAEGAVQFDAVSFAYSESGPEVLRAVSLDIAPGELVAIVGPSGAGKTTLCSLVPRFYDVCAGAVRIDGHDVRGLTLASLGQVAGLVFQDTYLFHGTLRDNLQYARADATEAELLSACDQAQLTGVIAGLAEGLDTVVGERGHRLSGGEKQRVAIARVILKRAPILILDEATSHLDSRSEQLVQQALARLFHGRTSLVIAHRLSTVLAADRIVVVDQGQIIEQGTHAQLIAAGGLYRSLYDLQFRHGSAEPVSA